MTSTRIQRTLLLAAEMHGMPACNTAGSNLGRAILFAFNSSKAASRRAKFSSEAKQDESMSLAKLRRAVKHAKPGRP